MYSCGFVIKTTKVYALDGAAHDSIIVGEVVDWNIPADSGSADNSAGMITDPWYGGYLYQNGTEYDGWNDDEEAANGGWDETERYGAMKFIRGYKHDANGGQVDIFTSPYGMYTAANSECTHPCEFGFDPDSLFANHARPDLNLTDSIDTDLHMGMTYLFKHNLGAGDTLILHTAYITTMNGQR